MLTKKLERRLLALSGKPLTLKCRSRRAEEDDEPDGDETTGHDEPDGDEEQKEHDEPDGDEREDDGSPGTVTGYAAVFHSEEDPGTEYELWSDPTMRAVERIARGAFSRACREQDDVRALFNHEPDQLLGRTSSGTLRISEDETGLRYDVDLPDTQVGRDLASLIDRGDINGSSFGFVVEQESWRESEEPDGKRVAVRTIEGVRLLDVGPVTYPAYASTTSGRLDDDPKAEENEEDTDPQAEESEDEDTPEPSPQRTLGSIKEARDSYSRWKREQVQALPLAAKLALIRSRAVEVESAMMATAGSSSNYR